MVLVDTSIWVDHFRNTNNELVQLLLENRVCLHPFVYSELSLGEYKNRKEILKFLQYLPQLSVSRDEDVHHLIEEKKIFGKGIGWVDAHLLCAAILNHATILTKDKNLLKFI